MSDSPLHSIINLVFVAAFVIQLNNLRFIAGHGVYDEERSIGNEFEVSLSLTVKAPKETVSSLKQTVNYADVYRVVKDIFSTPKPLLETLAMEIAEAIKQDFPLLKKISVQIVKLHPPIASFVGSVGVTFQKSYK